MSQKPSVPDFRLPAEVGRVEERRGGSGGGILSMGQDPWLFRFDRFAVWL